MNYSTPIHLTAHFKRQLLRWAVHYNHTLCYLDSNTHAAPTTPQYDLLLGLGVRRQVVNNLQTWQTEIATQQAWWFYTLPYDLKNDIEPSLHSSNPDGIHWQPIHCFQPDVVLWVRNGILTIEADDPHAVWHSLQTFPDNPPPPPPPPIHLTPRIPKQTYIHTVQQLKNHIIQGDLYELNFCQEFFAEQITLQAPHELFIQLNEAARAPFSAYYKQADKHLLCTSPERFLQKTGDKVTSQPIKGTIRRKPDPILDNQQKQNLLQSPKDRAENVMIVDLVRNDLARCCIPGTVQVTELFGIYSFERVHHMISTIQGQLKPNTQLVDLLKCTFPMGSMTGAPKVMAMQLIEQYEHTQRGLYAGSIGYLTPWGDADLNVVIRSILYNATSKYISLQVGGAIVYDSVPEHEYDECLLKAESITTILANWGTQS